MRNKIISRFLSVILAVGLSAAMFTTTAFAGGGDEANTTVSMQDGTPTAVGGTTWASGR